MSRSTLLKRVQHSLIYVLLLALLFVLVSSTYRGGVHLYNIDPQKVSLIEMPSVLLLSFFRMVVSYAASLFFAFILGITAATTKTGEKLVLPLLDILQSIPVVGFFPAAIGFFIGITHGHRIGVEFAAIFLIFTSQAWNLAFAVYEAVKAIPEENEDAIRSFGVVGSAKFWKLYAPTAVPRLIYNSILSWSNGWFFLVACEIIAVGPVKYNLPGIGSFLSSAAEQNKIDDVQWGLLALTVLILMMDFIFWRPLSNWAIKFRQEQTIGDQDSLSSPLTWPTTTKVLGIFHTVGPFFKDIVSSVFYPFTWFAKEIFVPLLWDLPTALFVDGIQFVSNTKPRTLKWFFPIATWMAVGIAAIYLGKEIYVWFSLPIPEIAKEIPLAILVSTLRIVFALSFSLLWILPVTVYVWDKPKFRSMLNTVSQVGASLPAIALFPLIILIAVRKFGGGMEIASIVLLLTGMQWYLLFNCLGGAATIPSDIDLATKSFGLTKIQTARLLVLPSIRPALITGAITAWGGGWNALVVSEYVTYKDEVMQVRGIGALINRSVYQLGDSRSITVCIVSLVIWILFINTLWWKPLYSRTIEKYRFDA